MFSKAVELAAQLVCVVAISVVISEAEECNANKTQEATKNVQLFREHLVRTNPRVNGLLVKALYSDIVVGWLIDRLVSEASDSPLLAASRRNTTAGSRGGE